MHGEQENKCRAWKTRKCTCGMEQKKISTKRRKHWRNMKLTECNKHSQSFEKKKIPTEYRKRARTMMQAEPNKTSAEPRKEEYTRGVQKT